MLVLVFHLGAERYALEAARVLEVLPRLPLRRLLGVPGCVAGVFDYRGQLTPVLDLCALFLDRPSAQRLSTRLMVVDYPLGSGRSRPLGLIAERMTETLALDPQALSGSGVKSDFACLGRVLAHREGPVQLVSVGELLGPDLRERLFPEEVTA